MAIIGNFIPEGSVKPDSLSVDSYEYQLSAKRVVAIPSNQQTLIDYNGGTNSIYIGTAPKGIPTSFGTDNDMNQPNWLIKKITLDTNNNPTAIQIGWGKWDNRATTVTYS
jgi:hypothetical protein